jgi:hypothetical protein
MIASGRPTLTDLGDHNRAHPQVLLKVDQQRYKAECGIPRRR